MCRMLVAFVVVSAFVLAGPAQQRDIPAPSRNSVPLLLAQSPWPRPCPPYCPEVKKAPATKNKLTPKAPSTKSA
jgi:hypothetical protein